jgi:hypothetical protein
VQQVGSIYKIIHKSYINTRIIIYVMNTSTKKNAINEVQFLTNITFLRVSAPGCHPQGVFQIEGLQAKHAYLGFASPSFG